MQSLYKTKLPLCRVHNEDFVHELVSVLSKQVFIPVLYRLLLYLFNMNSKVFLLGLSLASFILVLYWSSEINSENGEQTGKREAGSLI